MTDIDLADKEPRRQEWRAQMMRLIPPGGIGAVAISYYLARLGLAAFYQPFGLTPEDLQLSQTAMIASVASLAGVFLLMMVAIIIAIVFGYLLAAAAGATFAGQPKDFLPALGITGLMLFPFLLGWSLGAAWGEWATVAGLAMGAGVVLSISAWREKREEFVGKGSLWFASIRFVSFSLALIFAIAVGTLGEQALLGRVLMAMLLTLISLFLAYGQVSADLVRRSSSIVIPGFLVLGSVFAQVAFKGFAQGWIAVISVAIYLGFFGGCAVATTRADTSINDVRAFRRILPYFGPWGVASLIFLLVTSVLAVLVADYLSGNQAAARDLLRSGKVPTAWYIPAGQRVFPANVQVIDQDVAKICDGKDLAILLARTNDVNYVLLRSSASGEQTSPRVIGLPIDHYLVITGAEKQKACSFTRGSE